ncbi:hypothetical protein FDP22_08500 [Paroceanicella profunda]|uniref:Uncharacterized protein n=1 Tax=Paroceanicella profunda TaxID=2579971 RepID=A0A5B8FGY9_9RHOB|nr:hypothetical protein FDP22_08500 [Paroceanicella profunda]
MGTGRPAWGGPAVGSAGRCESRRPDGLWAPGGGAERGGAGGSGRGRCAPVSGTRRAAPEAGRALGIRPQRAPVPDAGRALPGRRAGRFGAGRTAALPTFGAEIRPAGGALPKNRVAFRSFHRKSCQIASRTFA